MTLAERIAEAKGDLGALYLQRERIQAQMQQLQAQAQQIQIAMCEKDGEIRAYELLKAEEAKG